MDNEVTVSDAPTPTLARRRLLGVGLGGAVSLLPALAGTARATSATTPPTEAATTTTAPPKRPTADDVGLLSFAQSVELAARDLYDVVLAQHLDDLQHTVLITLRESHEAYAQSLSGLLGRQAPGVAHSIATSLKGDFASDLPTALDAAYQLESAAVATHTEILGQLQGTDGAALIASILIVEGRHGTVLADLAGSKDLGRLLVDNEADAIAPAKG